MTVDAGDGEWCYSSTCSVHLPASSAVVPSGSPKKVVRLCCHDSSERHVCICFEKTLLEFDLDTATCSCELRIGEDVVSLRYLRQGRGQVAAFTRSGFIKVYDLIRGLVTDVAFALKKNQSLDGGGEADAGGRPAGPKMAVSSSHAGVFWSFGMSHSVYWISLKHSQEVIEKKHHVPTIEDAFRIKSTEAKSAVLALCSSKVGPLLAVGRIAGVVEIYNTATFKLIQRVQINAQGMIDMAVGESEDTFIVSSLSRPRASEYALHQNDFRFQEGNHTKTVAVHPRDSLCVIDGRLIGSHPRLIQVGAGELAAVNQETGAVVQVSLGDCWGNRIKVVRLAALEEERRRGSACADRSTPSQSIGVHPRSKAIFLCSKTKEDGEVALRMDIYNNVGRMKRDCCRNHTTCTTRKEEGSLDPTDIFASENAVEHFRANFDASTGSLRVEMTEIAVGASGSKRSFRAERKLGEGAILSAPIRVERVHRKNSVGSSGDFWILQCSQNLSLLLGRGLGGAELSVEHFSGRSCGFVSREDEGQPGVSFSVVNGRTFGLYERAAASEACSLIASHKLAESAEPSRLVSCRLAPSSSAGNSLIDYTWISDHGVFSGRADDPSGQVQIKAAWRLNAAHERILDATGVAAAVSVGLSGARVSASLALLTQRRLLFLSEDLCAARQIVLSENHGQVASLHWLESSKTLVCLGQARAMQVGEWDGYASMRSILSLDQTQSPSDHSEGSGFGGVGTSASGKSVLYFDRPLPGLQGGKVLACALPPPLGEDLGQQQKESVVIREIIEDLQPKVTKAESKIGFSIGGLNLKCHVDSPPSDQEKHLSLLMTNPSLVDLRYDEDPIQRVSTTDKDVIRIVLNLVAAGGSKETLRALFTDEKRRGSNGSEVGDETGAILQLNPYLMEMIQERSAPSSKMATASANGSADAAAENLTQSPAPSLLDSDAGHLTPGAPSSAGKGGAHAAQGLPSPDMPVVVSEPGNIDGNVSSGFGGGKWSDSDDSDEDSSSIFGSFSATSNARKKIMINIKPLAQGSATSSTSGGGGAGDLKSAIATSPLGPLPWSI